MVNPTTITVRERQRGPLKDNDIDSLARSIKRNGQIHPIVVRTEGDETVLVVGETRLRACIKLGIDVEIKFRDDLTPEESEVVELEENVKRSDLGWRQLVSGYSKIHTSYKRLHGESWTQEKSAECLSMHVQSLNMNLTVAKNLSNPALRDASSVRQAFSILQTLAHRQATQIVTELSDVGAQIFNQKNEPQILEIPVNSSETIDLGVELPTTDLGLPNGSGPDDRSLDIHNLPDPDLAPDQTPLPSSDPVRNPSPVLDLPSIISGNFLEWIQTYSGPKFNLIHCDFPYDVQYDSWAHSISGTKETDYDFKGFQVLLDSLVENFDKIASYSCHVMFWFSMEFYEKTRLKLESVGLDVHRRPLIWFKSDNAGIIPNAATHPRNVYETAFLASRGKRSLVRPLSNVWASPSPPNPLHPSQKSEGMLKHFFSMLVDNTTDVLDPTCGSGAAIRAAEDSGCRSALGLEIDPSYAKTALAATLTTRQLRKLKS